MSKRMMLAALASVCLLTNCTPYQDVDRDETAGDVAAPAPAEPDSPEAAPGVQDGAADGGAGEIDGAVAAAYKIQSKADIPDTVASMMTLADKDNDGQLTEDEFDLLAPALGQADNSTNPNGEGGAVGTPGAGDNAETSSATPIRAEDFFAETAGADGQVSAADLTTALTARFESVDTDANGTLSADEAKNFAASMLFSRE
jgi:hypothetical protein